MNIELLVKLLTIVLSGQYQILKASVCLSLALERQQQTLNRN